MIRLKSFNQIFEYESTLHSIFFIWIIETFQEVKLKSPDYKDVPQDEAVQDFLSRIEFYEQQYEPIDEKNREIKRLNEVIEKLPKPMSETEWGKHFLNCGNIAETFDMMARFGFVIIDNN